MERNEEQKQVPGGHPNAQENEYSLEERVIFLHIVYIFLQRNVLFHLKKTHHWQTLIRHVKDQTCSAILGGVRGDSDGQRLLYVNQGTQTPLSLLQKRATSTQRTGCSENVTLDKSKHGLQPRLFPLEQDHFSIQRKWVTSDRRTWWRASKPCSLGHFPKEEILVYNLILGDGRSSLYLVSVFAMSSPTKEGWHNHVNFSRFGIAFSCGTQSQHLKYRYTILSVHIYFCSLEKRGNKTPGVIAFNNRCKERVWGWEVGLGPQHDDRSTSLWLRSGPRSVVNHEFPDRWFIAEPLFEPATDINSTITSCLTVQQKWQHLCKHWNCCLQLQVVLSEQKSHQPH